MGRSAAITLVAGLLLSAMCLAGPGSAAAEGPAADGQKGPRYSDMFYLAPAGYLVLDGSGQVTESNLTAATLLGVSWKELLSSSLASFVASQSQKNFQDHFRAVVREICKQAVEVRFTGQGGREVRVQLESMCVFDESGNHSGFRVVMHELTDRQRAEAGEVPLG